MSRLARRLAVMAVAGATVLATSSTALAQTDKPPTKGVDCVVQYVDERGGIIRTETEPEGREYGRFRCASGQWTFAWDPFGADDAIVADEVVVDPSGVVSVRRFTGPALGNDLTIGEITAIAQAVTGSGEVMVDRAIVAVDDGKQRTPEEIAALLAGKDDTGVRVLGTIDKPDAAMSAKDVIDEAGGTPEGSVVYFSILGAIKSVFAWVADTISDIGDWIERHCDWGLSPSGLGVVVTCRW
ncbi:hypothetical protein [Micromonospora sp. WMMD736]|uniref:hypothetical protein n=1 Tax=Micromonospora sp. WMMD736 TaxID=3404112 RepID=UPI003B95ECC3